MSQQAKPQKQSEYHPDELIFIQSRAEINLTIVDEYADMMANGTVFDPIEGVQDDNGIIYIFDGFHRGEAAKRVGTTLLVNLQSGTRTEAEWLALTANQKHGLRRTNKDKQHVVRQALRHPYGIRSSNREIARHCGVDDKTVGRIRQELETTAEVPQLSKRVVRKADGQTYEIDTTNIGSKPTPQQVQASRMPKQVVVESPHSNQNGHKPDDTLSSTRPDQYPEFNAATSPDAAEQPKYQLKPQEFECPRCGQEKIVGVNGSRRWCLNCLAEWPTANAFLAEVNADDEQDVEQPSRQQLQSRFQNILARLDEPELGKVKTWLDTLEDELDLAEASVAINEEVTPINTIPMLEYA
ncbi:MAG: ParB N-terminal domain-containing protein [Anaerolineae bacterium]|nr:ParB N-terminal domain-containing protein [Anaerolineae bacterium]